MECRHCKKEVDHCLIDLGFSPPSNAYLSKEDLKQAEIHFPLRVYVCHHCWLVQTEDYSSSEEIFNSGYAYFSSTSSSWVAHAKQYVDMITQKLELGENKFVVEIASNDGYLLQHFVQKNIPCLGIEPTKSTATASREKSINTLEKFFTETTSKNIPQADLIIGNNVFAHVPDINDFTKGLKQTLKPNGTITLEFPHLLNLIQQNQFDTIYHEHFSYLSLYTTSLIFDAVGLKIYDVEQLPTHGGSLRVYGCHKESSKAVTNNVDQVLKLEEEAHLKSIQAYSGFTQKAFQIKNQLVSFLLKAQSEGKKVVAYGAAAKGNTLLNFSGIKKDLLSVVYDANKHKQGKYLPGSYIPISPPESIEQENPDYVIVFPWNIKKEIKEALSQYQIPNARYVTFIPELAIL